MISSRILTRIFPLLLIFITGCVSFQPRIKPGESKKIEHKKAGKIYVRVLLFKNISSLIIDGKNFTLNEDNTGRVIKKSGAFEVILNRDSAVVADDKMLLPVTIYSDESFTVNGIRLKGQLSIGKNAVILRLPLERYVSGVVSSEMNNSWPIEALKAQAIVSRTFVVHRMLTRKDRSFDIGISEMHQVYLYKSGDTKVEEAVNDTSGLILVYDGKPILSLYHSCSGGRTESAGNVFSKDLPYLRSIYDPYSLDCPDKRWECSFDSDVIAESLNRFSLSGGNNHDHIGISNILIESRTSSGRVKNFKIELAGGDSYLIRGNDFRIAVGSKKLRSLLIDKIKKIKSGGTVTFVFYGRGYGHGVGMSQWGAKKMAENGFNYERILKFYYRDVKIEDLSRLKISE